MAPPPAPVTAAPALSPPPTVKLRLRLEPPTAHVTVDGTAATDNPLTLTRGKHTLELSESGFGTVVREIVAEKDDELSITLQRPPRLPTRKAAPKRKLPGPVEREPL
jgi:hypothetical protein